MATTTVEKVDYTNIGLMILATVLALNLPFELFLFSYAVLGPLHYITEISWLHKKQYFTVARNDYWIFVALCLILFFGYMFISATEWQTARPLYEWIGIDRAREWLQVAGRMFPHMVFVAFAAAVIVILVKKVWPRVLLIGCSLGLGLVLGSFEKNGDGAYSVMFGTLLTTMIHVWLFTGIFILAGALKNNKSSGFISLGAFVLCSLSFILLTPVNLPQYALEGTGVMATFQKSTFSGVTATLYNLFHGSSKDEFVLVSAVGLKLQGFMAFAYTYHYLNWFSKTSVIKWHQVPKKWIAGSLAVWILSMALYAYDYSIGLQALFFLSMLHVFLEFPLNHRTIYMVATDILGRMRGARPGVGTR